MVHDQSIGRADTVSQNRDTVKKSLNPTCETVQGFANFSLRALRDLAKNPDTPIVTLKWLAAHFDVEVRRALASNHNIGRDILHILARDGEESVKKAVLDNEKIGTQEIVRLCYEPNLSIAEKASQLIEKKGKSKISHNRAADANAISHSRATDATANIDISKARKIRSRFE